MHQAAKRRISQTVVLLATVLALAVALPAAASIPPLETRPSLDELAAQVVAAPPAPAVAGEPFRLYTPGEDPLAGAAPARFHLFAEAKTRVRGINLDFAPRVELHSFQVIERTGFALFGGGKSRRWTQNRHYDPQLGRFLQPDPLGYVDGPNVYQYGLNNPANYSDPMGLAGEPISQAAGPDRTLRLIEMQFEAEAYARQVEEETSAWGIFKDTLSGTGRTVANWYRTKRGAVVEGAGDAARESVLEAIPEVALDPNLQRQAAEVGLQGQPVTGASPGAILQNRLRSEGGEIAEVSAEGGTDALLTAVEGEVTAGVAAGMFGRFARSLSALDDMPWGQYCRTGCEDVAKRIQSTIGGRIHRIEPGLPGARYLGPRNGVWTEWSYHEAVVRNGRVYDAMTGPTGLPIREYKMQWEYADDINFGF